MGQFQSKEYDGDPYVDLMRALPERELIWWVQKAIWVSASLARPRGSSSSAAGQAAGCSAARRHQTRCSSLYTVVHRVMGCCTVTVCSRLCRSNCSCTSLHWQRGCSRTMQPGDCNIDIICQEQPHSGHRPAAALHRSVPPLQQVSVACCCHVLCVVPVPAPSAALHSWWKASPSWTTSAAPTPPCWCTSAR